MSLSLHAVMYHYVRDLPQTRFPRIKGMLTDDFQHQVALLSERYEMATLESALAFLWGQHVPRQDLCLLTFDDGLKEHYMTILPILSEHRIQGLFFVITSCLEEQWVASVHKNHFLMAALDFAEYREAFLVRLAELSPERNTEVNLEEARCAYRWDTPEVAAFKYLLNFRLPDAMRDRILDGLFESYLGDEAEFARQLYLSWGEAQEMQSGGMLIGGHSHSHMALATLDHVRQQADLGRCMALLRGRLNDQDLWPFSYPYGKMNSFNSWTVRSLRDLGFACAFATEVGSNQAGQDAFRIRRIDPKDVAV